MKWLNMVKETSGVLTAPTLEKPIQEPYPFMTPTDDLEGFRAMLCHAPGIGDFWCAVDETARAEVASDGLPCILPEDLAFITGGTTKQDRFNRLLGRVSRNHPMVQGILDIFPGSKVTRISKRNAS